jgi:hypothetical protein
MVIGIRSDHSLARRTRTRLLFHEHSDSLRVKLNPR